jgi:hypothetical protein
MEDQDCEAPTQRLWLTRSGMGQSTCFSKQHSGNADAGHSPYLEKCWLDFPVMLKPTSAFLSMWCNLQKSNRVLFASFIRWHVLCGITKFHIFRNMTGLVWHFTRENVGAHVRILLLPKNWWKSRNEPCSNQALFCLSLWQTPWTYYNSSVWNVLES